MNLERAEAITPQHAVNSTELAWLAEHAASANLIIELGSFLGRSTRALADNTPGVVYAVDPWTWRGGTRLTNGHMTKNAVDDVFDAFCANLREHIDAHKVFPCRLTSQQFFERLNPLTLADLVFIDADHNYLSTKWEIEHYLTRLAPDGIICGHDYDWPAPPAGQPGVTQAVNALFTETEVQHCDTIWWVQR